MMSGDTVHAVGERTSRRRRRAATELLFAGLAGVLAIVAAAYVQELWRIRLQVPVFPTGDSRFTQAIARTVAEHGWVTSNPSLGAPFGSTMQDLVVVYGDATQLLLMSGLGLFSDSGPAIVNVLYVLGFGLIAGATYLLLRGLDLSRGVALAVGVVFALAHYHFERAQGHLFLGMYYAVPALAWLLYGVLGHHDVVRRRTTAGSRWRSWLSGRTGLTVAIAALVGTSEVYYAVFGLALLALLAPILAATRGWRRAVPALAIAGVIATTALAVQLPSLAHQASNGANTSVSERSPVESELYGLRLTELILPDSYHRLSRLPRSAGATSTATRSTERSVTNYLARSGPSGSSPRCWSCSEPLQAGCQPRGRGVFSATAGSSSSSHSSSAP